MSAQASATFELPQPPASRVRCLECAGRACEALSALPGVTKVECDPSGGAVRVDFDPERTTEADLAMSLHGFGMELAETLHHVAWRITGLD